MHAVMHAVMRAAVLRVASILLCRERDFCLHGAFATLECRRFRTIEMAIFRSNCRRTAARGVVRRDEMIPVDDVFGAD
jgi:hypothetical protein